MDRYRTYRRYRGRVRYAYPEVRMYRRIYEERFRPLNLEQAVRHIQYILKYFMSDKIIINEFLNGFAVQITTGEYINVQEQYERYPNEAHIVRFLWSEVDGKELSVICEIIKPSGETETIRYYTDIHRIREIIIYVDIIDRRKSITIYIVTDTNRLKIYFDPKIELPSKEEIVETGKKVAPYVKKGAEIAVKTAPYWLPLVGVPI